MPGCNSPGGPSPAGPRPDRLEPMPTLTTEKPPLLADEAGAIAAARGLADVLRDGAAARDRSAVYPADVLDAVPATGLLGIAVPPRLGGPGAAPGTVARVLAVFAEADPSVAQLLLGHFVVQRVVLGAVPAANAAVRDAILREVLAGARLGVLAAERGTPHALQRRTAIVSLPGGGHRVDGTKYYSTGARGSRWIAVLGQLDGDPGRPGVALVPVDPHDPPEGLRFEDDWDAFGQRGTASGTVHLDGLKVRDDHVIDPGPPPAAPPPTIAGAYDQLLHLAIDVGIARAALADGARHVRERSRPWFEAGVERAAEEPQVVIRFGQLAVRLQTLDALFERAAAEVDRAAGAERLDDHNSAAASLAVAAAKALAQEVAVSIASDVIELAGASATDGRWALDRHWRNARVHTVHDPARWKYFHIGNHLLNGVRPPRHPRI